MSHAAVERPISTRASESIAWECEVFLLSGEDRRDLLARIGDLSAWLDHNPEATLKDLAYTLNRAELLASRLAVVAGTVEDLRKRLARAAERLADAKCRQIKDVSGIYYAEEPLASSGKLALLFPGEGAQYVNMVGDLREHFPEVRDCFASCDALVSRNQGRTLSEAIFVPPEATPEARAAAEKELSGLGNAIYSVLIADWALEQLLERLGVYPDAVAGHSAGELAALWTAGCFDGEGYGLDHVGATMQNLQRQEDESSVESVLLAVGASRRSLTEMLEQTLAGDRSCDISPESLVAMDNCPHQTVLVGPPSIMARLEEELRSRRLVYERLSLQRPYHTPLFQPFMGPLRQMFSTTTFLPPRKTIYSCTTARPFPHDPDAIRELMLSHWSSRVEFTQMINNMYADGVRLFVEAGPKGNLCAFVEDILRGQPFLAVPANVQRRSGISQLCHLVAQLAAHHVPLALDHLYCRREPQVIDWDYGNATSPPRDDQEPMHSLPTPSARSAVLSEYWNTMEQFLDTQCEVMEQFLRRRGGVHSATNNRLSTWLSSIVEPPAVAEPMQTQQASSSTVLIGEIVEHTPGRELVMRRKLDLAEDLYAGDHTVGGRSISKVDPTQHGLPIMPMTFTLEIMAQAASLLVPGKVVAELKDIRLFRWLEFDKHDPVTVELTARLKEDAKQPSPAMPGAVTVSVEIRHLGNSKSPPGSSRFSAMIGNVVLADEWPAPPAAGTFPLTDEHPCRISMAELHRNLFHGPLFHGVRSLGRTGQEGLESQIQVLPHHELFRSTAQPNLLTDPVLLDVVMHPLAAWHLEQPDQSGRILLPCELESVRFFGPPPAAGTNMTSRVRTVHESRRQITHAVDTVRPDGVLWCRMSAVKYWRFYLPFGDINFHGPKDEYFLSQDWEHGQRGPAVAGDKAADVWTKGGRNATARKTNANDSERRPEQQHCVRLDPPADLLQPAMLAVTAQITLSPIEQARFAELKGPDRNRAQWLFGRIAAKDAVRLLWWSRQGQRLFPADIEIEPDVHGRPMAIFRDHNRSLDFPNVSISHSEHVHMALAAYSPYVGIDVEKVVPRDKSFETIAFDEHEQRLLDELAGDRHESITRLWCAKEAVGKALGRGLVDGPRSLSVLGFNATTGLALVSLNAKLAGEFPHLADRGLQVHTSRDQDFVVATTLCEPAT